MRSARKPLWLVLAALVSAVGMWVYAVRVLVPYQTADAAAHDRPRGNLSDLYPRWLGARELLLHGRDPYSHDVTAEIQAGYYGRPLDPNRPADPKDQQAFAYPLYVIFLLAPLVHLPFSQVQPAFFWFLLVLTAVTIPLWVRFLQMRLSLRVQVSILAWALGSFAVMQALNLQQMTLLVAGLIAAGLALLVCGYPIPAGVFLALATIKPQLVLLLLLWLTVWTFADLRSRARLAISFLITIVVLIAASALYMPHWIYRFWSAIVDYQAYTNATPVLDQLVWRPLARLLELFALILCAYFCWRHRRASNQSEAFATVTSLVLAITVLDVPTFAPYNQIFLLPAMMLLVRQRQVILQTGKAGRFLWAVSAALVAWQWLASTLLAAMSMISPANRVLRAWAVPTWTLLFIPVTVAALMLVYTHRTAVTAQIATPTA